MTIPRTIDIETLNRRLSNLDACVRNAPVGTYDLAKDISHEIGLACDGLIKAFQRRGLRPDNCDGIRVVEAAIFGWVAANPLLFDTLAAAEGFGEHSENPECADRVIAGAIRDRDALAAMKANDPTPGTLKPADYHERMRARMDSLSDAERDDIVRQNDMARGAEVDTDIAAEIAADDLDKKSSGE